MMGRPGVERAALVGWFADLLGDLGVGDAEASDELTGLLDQPWRWYAGPDRAVSPLTTSGAPFELSLKLAATAGPNLRYVVDCADHRRDLAGNLGRYLDAAEQTTGLAREPLAQLLACHLDDAPDNAVANVMHGIGYGPSGRRSSLYVPSGWLTAADLATRLPMALPLPGPAQVVGYDFADGGLAAWKTYHWEPVDPDAAWTADPAAATAAALVHDRFVAGLAPARRATAVFRQRRADPGGWADKFFFFAGPWGWTGPGGLSALLGFLAESMTVDLRPLRAVAAAARRREVEIHLGLLAVDGAPDSPVLTFYFWPAGRGT